MSTWIVQRKVFRGDWETVATFEGKRKQALARYSYMDRSPVRIRAVSEKQADADHQAGRADDYKRKLEAK